jgi:hypothetical protein
MKNYASRFREFLGMLPGAESLDNPAILLPNVPIKRADYLLFQRSMIVEVKQLESDPEFKVESIIERYRSLPSYPLFFGKRTLQAVLEHMPADLQEEIKKMVYDAISRSISGDCEEGNRQIRETREYFGLSRASGVIFILNDRIPILSPNVLAARVRQQMHKRTSAGADRFPEISHVCGMSWAHLVLANDATPAHPVAIVEGPASRSHPNASGQLDYILDAWSRNENATLLQDVHANLEDYQSDLPATSTAQIRAHEAWRAAYRGERYLEAMDTPALMTHGQSVFAELAPHFLLDAEKHGDLSSLMHRWTHFLEECELRNLDMRHFSPEVPGSHATDGT